jgi:para-aminobenzoate synthetase / 4-amino-4-deoxychorismate lyase
MVGFMADILRWVRLTQASCRADRRYGHAVAGTPTSADSGDMARVVAIELAARVAPAAAAGWLRGLERPVALAGRWLGGGLILSSDPLLRLGEDADPFATFDTLPFAGLAAPGLDSPPAPAPAPIAPIGGGWIGWLGFGLASSLEPVGPAAGRRRLPDVDLAFHDHLVHCDGAGRWWFEALWTDARDAVLRERLEWWRARLADGEPPGRPASAGPLRPRAGGLAGHRAAVAETVARIAAGELSQANVCLALEGGRRGDPLDLWIAANHALAPGYAAYIGGDDHAVASLSPELFLRRRGRTVTSEPIKGTAPRDTDPARLAASVKDRAENVMIVDLMRNDLGRVCAYGTVAVPELCAVRPAAGVWHLVSTVTGELRPGIGDAELLRATFPPGSVTGAPKVQALRLIHGLEPTPREVYCGAIGIGSPLAGLELNVAIRTLEIAGDRVWLGAGGGIVADSDPDAEVAEALAKARGVADAAGIALDAVPMSVSASPAPASVRHPRPDPAAGVIETLRVAGGAAPAAGAHLSRLTAAARRLGLSVDPALRATVAAAARELGDGALRIVLDESGMRLATRPRPGPGATHLEPVSLPGGLGTVKWADRSLIDALSAGEATPLFCELDGTVLEAGYAAILMLDGARLLAPPLDGRILDSVSRRAALAAAPAAGLRVIVRGFSLDAARAADALVLCSSLRGPHPGVLAGGPAAAASAQLCARLHAAGA